MEYSKRYEQTNPLSQDCVHLLSEAHLLLRASLLCPTADGDQIQEAFQESCAQLGDCFSRWIRENCSLSATQNYHLEQGVQLKFVKV